MMELRSPAFVHKGEIPQLYTCEGHDISPPLSWAAIPTGTKSLALIVDDPDAPDPAAPRVRWVHWVVFNIPPTVTELPENADSKGLPPGTQQGLNDWKRRGYGGPCPPVGRHRYIFTLYALDTLLNLDRPTKSELEEAMEGHILGKAVLIGTYQKRRR